MISAAPLSGSRVGTAVGRAARLFLERASGLVLAACLTLMASAVWGENGSAESPDFLLKLFGTFDPATVVGDPAPGRGVAESGVLVVDLRGITGPSDGERSAESPVFEINLLGTRGGLAVSGVMVDGAAGGPLDGVLVQVSDRMAASAADGTYTVSGVTAGEWLLTASKPGYVTAQETVVVAPGTSPRRDLTLWPLGASGGNPRILSIRSKFAGFTCFIDGAGFPIVGFPVTWTATVDWAGHPPGSVRFTTPEGTFDVATTGTVASRSFDMAKDFSPGGTLIAVAVSADGTRSPEAEAPCVVAPNPFGGFLPTMGVALEGDEFSYNAKFNLEFFDQAVGGEMIPESIPIFGGNEIRMSYVPTISAEIGSGGRARLEFAWEDAEYGDVLKKESRNKNHNLELLGKLLSDLQAKGRLDKRHLPKQGFGGFNIHWFPLAGGELQYDPSGGAWELDDVFGGLGGEIKAKYSWPFAVFMVPAYLKGTVTVAAEAVVQVYGLDPLALGGEIAAKPRLRLSLGAGLDEILAIEGWGEGGLDFRLKWPADRNPDECKGYVALGGTVYALLWSKEYRFPLKEWDFLNPGGSASGLMTIERPPLFQPAPRDYLGDPDYGRFVGRQRVALQAAGPPGTPLRALLAPLQVQVFPRSDAACAAAGTNFSLAWLYDEPSRSLNNRSMAVFSQFNGDDWSEPMAIADDGTADFHPHLLAFADGSAVATWEDEGAALSDDATFEDMKRHLEISAAFYDPVARVWLGSHRFTTNAILDRSPRLAGRTHDNLLLTWIANDVTEVDGTSAPTNHLWWARWNGSTWSSPQLAATIPHPLLKYALAYDGSNAHFVASVDADDDPQTLDDHELLHVKLAAGVWGPAEWLTADELVDDNPQLALDPAGNFVLVWVRSNQVSSVVSLDFSRREIVREEPAYSSNLADFRLASSPDGRMALVWAEPSESLSDLWTVFYDPLFLAWGGPKQLTFDAETERGSTAAFFGVDTLMIVYNRSAPPETGTGPRLASVGAVAPSIPKPGGTDLYVLEYRLGEDLALETNALISTPPNPTPGEPARLQTTVINYGDHVVSEVPVAFYLGDPARGGIEVGRTNVMTTLLPGGRVDVYVVWNVPETASPVGLFAIVDPEAVLADADRQNNIVRGEFVKADPAVATVVWSRVSEGLMSLTARVANQGSLTSAPTTLRFITGLTNVFFTSAIPALAPGESVDVGFLWDVSDLTQDMEITASLDGLSDAIDFDTGNNALRLVIQRVAEPVAPQLAPVMLLPGGAFQFTLTGVPGRAYTIKASTNLVDWLDLTNVVLPSVTVPLTDPDAPGHPQRFYRAVGER